METTVLRIEGMSCSHCEKAVTDALEGVNGVRSVQVDLNGGEATVSYDSNEVNEDTLKDAVENAGYKVVARS